MRLNVRISSLDNGLRVVTATMPHVDSVSMGIWVGAGGRHEPASLNGISHFIEHLLFKGTKTLSAREISEAIEGRGGYFNAFTQEESTCYYARAAAEYTAEVFEILADMYLHPRFAAEDIERERSVILEEISMYNDQPEHVAGEMLGQLLWPTHPLGRPLTGTERAVRRITRAHILDFKASRYTPTNTLVLFAGAADHSKALQLTTKGLQRLPRRRLPTMRPVTAQIRQRHFASKRRPIEQTYIALGFRLFGRRDPRRFALKLLSVILGENTSSRLFQIVREQHGLAYSIQSGTSLLTETGVLSVNGGVDVERSQKALKLIISELTRLKKDRVASRELQHAKDYTVGQLRLGLENSGNQLLWVGEHLLGFGRIVQPEEYVQQFSAVTPDDLRAVARAVMRPDRLSLAMVSPLKKSAMQEIWRTAVAALDPTPR